jgi:ATP-binding cassette subfamily F protein uup
VLSGADKNRVLLAKLFVSPANLLVLDEPTNDLDIETLELLEELICDFKGTVLLICHDRTFLNNVVSSTLVFAANGEIKEIVGGYDEWLQERKLEAEAAKKAQPNHSNNNQKAEIIDTKPKKLSFKEKQELAALPKMIEDAEKEVAEIQAKLADPLFYKSGENPNLLNQRISELEDAQLNYMERLEELQLRQ